MELKTDLLTEQVVENMSSNGSFQAHMALLVNIKVVEVMPFRNLITILESQIELYRHRRNRCRRCPE